MHSQPPSAVRIAILRTWSGSQNGHMSHQKFCDSIIRFDWCRTNRINSVCVWTWIYLCAKDGSSIERGGEKGGNLVASYRVAPVCGRPYSTPCTLQNNFSPWFLSSCPISPQRHTSSHNILPSSHFTPHWLLQMWNSLRFHKDNLEEMSKNGHCIWILQGKIHWLKSFLDTGKVNWQC